MTTLAQALAQHSGEFATMVHKAIEDWCKAATAEEMKAAFFPEQAGVEIFVPPREIAIDPPLESAGTIYVIKVGADNSYQVLMDADLPFIFHDKEAARAVAKVHGIPYGNIVSMDMWRLDREA